MSDRPQFTSAAGPAGPPAAVPAAILPARFEDFEGFRETTLAAFTDPQANTTLRGLGTLLYDMALEYTAHWPHEPCGAFFHQVRAVLADLRHLEGWLAHLAAEVSASVLDFEEEQVAAVCGTLAADLKAAGDTLQARIPWAVDPDAPLPLSEVARLSHPLPWEEQRETARGWLLKVWERAGGEAEGTAKLLLRDVRELAGRMGSFSFYHVLGLELLTLLRERQSAKAFNRINGPALLTYFLSGPDVPEEVRAHYTAAEKEE
jgi:hypothetical protein